MALAIDAILVSAGYQPGAHFQVRRNYRVDPLNQVLSWTHPTDPYPSQAQLDAWEVTAQAAIDANSTLNTERSSIKTLAIEANQHAAKIRLVFAAIVNAERLGKDADNTFVDIANALNDASIPNAFRTLVLTAFTAQSGLTINLGNLALNILGTRQSFNSFAKSFFTRWALMVMIGS